MAISANNQQRAIVDAVLDGTRIVIGNALAGSGKTSTAEHIANEMAGKGKSMLYLVFNKANAVEAQSRFLNTRAQTAHGFAFGSVHPDTIPASIQAPKSGFFGGLNQPYRTPPRGKTMGEVYSGRLVGSIYHALRDMRDINEPTANAIARVGDSYGVGRKINLVIQETLRKFCQTGDEEIKSKHIPSEFRYHIEAHESNPDYTPIIQISQHLFDMMRDPNGKMPVDHGFYLKLCSMYPPRIGQDFILLDEAQDANPAMIKIIDHQIQQGSQAVFMGDTYQHIYSFTGAIDSMKMMKDKYGDDTKTLPLTSSYRFGPQIADAGNVFLKLLGSEYELEGLGDPNGSVRPSMSGLGQVTRLYRSNMAMLMDVINNYEKNIESCVLKGSEPLKKLLIGVADMLETGRSSHPEISNFESWDELVGYSETKDGSNLKPVIKYVGGNNGNISKAVNALDSSTDKPKNAKVIAVTGHTSKGLQWPNVELSPDFQAGFFPSNEGEYNLPDINELALLYVASTRAREMLITNGMIGAVKKCLENAEIPPTEAEVTEKARLDNAPYWELQRSLLGARKGDKPDVQGALDVMARMRQPYAIQETMPDMEKSLSENPSKTEANLSKKTSEQMNLFGD